jgi:hypothetical protein
MRNKFVVWLTLAAFAFFDFACVVHHVVRETPLAAAGDNGLSVLGVLKKNGEEVTFPKGSAARVVGERVIGSSINIPLADCDLVWVRRVNPAGTFLATVGGVALVLTGIVAIIALTKESCPFIYSFDGRDYVFDAEPYGGATSKGLQRTEWCGLEHLRAVDGLYKIRLTNEVDETQHTDELKLVVVDHPVGVGLAADEQGGLHTIAAPLRPTAARDAQGRDLLPLVQTRDWISWQSRLDDKDPAKDGNLREELTFEFPRPAGTTRAKLVFNGGTTLWGSQMLKRFLELYGAAVGKHYLALDGSSQARASLDAWNLREELYRLWIRVETGGGWTTRGTIVGGGPFMTEDRVYPLDLAGIPGDTLRIKLTPPAGFWTINSLAVDYSSDQPVRATELEPASAVDPRGADIRDLLARPDGRDYAAPEMGNLAELTFLAPPEVPGLARTVLAKVSGYYDIHLKAQGAPRLDLLNRISSEPGFPARFALGEYRRWMKSLVER